MVFDATWTLTDAKNPREEELQRIFEEAKKDAPRTHLMIVLAYNGAMRAAELIHFKVSDFNFSTGTALILPLKKAGKKRVKGQDGKVRIVDRPLPKKVEYPFPGPVIELVAKYVKAERLKPDSWLFPGMCAKSCNVLKLECPGGHVTKRAVQKIFDRVCRAAGAKVPGRGIHSLKHGRLTEVARKSKDPYLVKEAGRHSSVALSDKYVKYTDFQEQMKQIGGRL